MTLSAGATRIADGSSTPTNSRRLVPFSTRARLAVPPSGSGTVKTGSDSPLTSAVAATFGSSRGG